MREVEHDALQEEHEGHPLVVGLDLFLAGPGVVGPDACLRDVIADVGLVVYVVPGHGEGAGDVAVVVDDVLWVAIQ